MKATYAQMMHKRCDASVVSIHDYYYNIYKKLQVTDCTGPFSIYAPLTRDLHRVRSTLDYSHYL